MANKVFDNRHHHKFIFCHHDGHGTSLWGRTLSGRLARMLQQRPRRLEQGWEGWELFMPKFWSFLNMQHGFIMISAGCRNKRNKSLTSTSWSTTPVFCGFGQRVCWAQPSPMKSYRTMSKCLWMGSLVSVLGSSWNANIQEMIPTFCGISSYSFFFLRLVNYIINMLSKKADWGWLVAKNFWLRVIGRQKFLAEGDWFLGNPVTASQGILAGNQSTSFRAFIVWIVIGSSKTTSQMSIKQALAIAIFSNFFLGGVIG